MFGRFAAVLLLLGAMAVPPSPARAMEPVDNVVVLKKERKMQLRHGDRVLRVYGVALGYTPEGHKRWKGDGRTPEGRYTISAKNPKSYYHMALRISYPSAQDVAEARQRGDDPGGDILIHGLPNGQGGFGAAHRVTDWTEGCIAVTNAEIEEIFRLVPVGTPIEIRP